MNNISTCQCNRKELIVLLLFDTLAEAHRPRHISTSRHGRNLLQMLLESLSIKILNLSNNSHEYPGENHEEERIKVPLAKQLCQENRIHTRRDKPL